MLWVKVFHIVFMVTWFAGLFYLPRLFVYHAMAADAVGIERFKVMERKLYYGIMTPGAVLTIVLGLWLWLGFGIGGAWMHAKAALVLVLIAYHLYCGKLLADFKRDRNRHGHVFYRWFNEAPVLLLIAIVVLVVIKPNLANAQTAAARIIVQSSPLAGFRHYEAPNLWNEIKPGDPLRLVREPGNPHDRNAIRVEWRGFKLGYVPRSQNASVARQMDHGTGIEARVSKVQATRAPNQRIEFEVYVPFEVKAAG
jgi:putative membrane protein